MIELPPTSSPHLFQHPFSLPPTLNITLWVIQAAPWAADPAETQFTASITAQCQIEHDHMSQLMPNGAKKGSLYWDFPKLQNFFSIVIVVLLISHQTWGCLLRSSR